MSVSFYFKSITNANQLKEHDLRISKTWCEFHWSQIETCNIHHCFHLAETPGVCTCLNSHWTDTGHLVLSWYALSCHSMTLQRMSCYDHKAPHLQTFAHLDHFTFCITHATFSINFKAKGSKESFISQTGNLLN